MQRAPKSTDLLDVGLSSRPLQKSLNGTLYQFATALNFLLVN
jgi:hypothetical protein